MDKRSIQLNLELIDLADAVQIEFLRLLAYQNQPHLVLSATAATGGSSTRLSWVPVQSSAEPLPLIELPQVLPVPPRWDITADPTGGWVIVYEVAQGAINTLCVTRGIPDETPISIAPPQMFASLGNPRFFRGVPRANALGFSTIINSTHAMACLGAPDGEYVPLLEAVDALIVHLGSGSILFFKSLRPGPVRGEDISRGALCCVRLDSNFRAEGSVYELFRGVAVFEFDAERCGSDLVVVATSEAGLECALLQVKADAVLIEAQRSLAHEAELIRPAIVAAADQIHIAAIRVAASDPKRVWAGRVVIETDHG